MKIATITLGFTLLLLASLAFSQEEQTIDIDNESSSSISSSTISPNIIHLDEYGYVKDSYPKWQNIEFTYKNYNSEPSIDSYEFYKSIKDDFYLCNPYPAERYPALKTEELILMSEVDPHASFDLYMYRETGKTYLKKSADMMHLTAIILNYDPSFYKEQMLLNKYELITPLAVLKEYIISLANYTKLKNGDIQNEEVTKEIIKYNDKVYELSQKLKGADNMWLTTLYISSKMDKTDVIDKDLLCEAYYNGCASLYEYKAKYNIQCDTK